MSARGLLMLSMMENKFTTAGVATIATIAAASAASASAAAARTYAGLLNVNALFERTCTYEAHNAAYIFKRRFIRAIHLFIIR